MEGPSGSQTATTSHPSSDSSNDLTTLQALREQCEREHPIDQPQQLNCNDEDDEPQHETMDDLYERMLFEGNNRLQPLNHHLNEFVPRLLQQLNGQRVEPCSDDCHREGTERRVLGNVAEVDIISTFNHLSGAHPVLATNILELCLTSTYNPNYNNSVPNFVATTTEQYIFHGRCNKKNVNLIRNTVKLIIQFLRQQPIQQFIHACETYSESQPVDDTSNPHDGTHPLTVEELGHTFPNLPDTIMPAPVDERFDGSHHSFEHFSNLSRLLLDIQSRRAAERDDYMNNQYDDDIDIDDLQDEDNDPDFDEPDEYEPN